MISAFPILQVGPLPDALVSELRSRFAVRHVDGPEWALDTAGAADIRGIATTGKSRIGREHFDSMPKLEIISCLGAGSEGIDTGAAAERGIVIATTSAVLAADVADVAMGLIIASAREFGRADRFMRAGAWTGGRHRLGVSLQGAVLGIVGLGNIGAALARRAAAFDMDVLYHTRSPRLDVPWRHVADLDEMARSCRFLALCCPGGPETYHLITASVLESLGPSGYLINVARGSVVDEVALAEAVTTGKIAGAGLDVFENEPHPHPALLASPNVTLLPHIGSATHETREKMAAAMIEALERHAVSRI